jgi:agmatine deiminase
VSPDAGPTASPRELGFRFPAEWDRHEATWLAWPHNESDWPGKFHLVPPVFHAMVRELTRHERVRIIVASEATRSIVTKRLAEDVDLGAVDFFVHPTNRSWTRDFVPIFVVRDGIAGVREVAAVKFTFDGWARYPNHLDDDAAGARVAEWLTLRGFRPEAAVGGSARRIVLEGGGIDTDGYGTLLATEECLFSGPRGRNPWLGKKGTERVLSEQLGIDRVLWLTTGIAGDDTSGHVDDFCRFVRPGVIALCREPNGSDENHRPLEENRERLEGAVDARGRRLEVVPLPMPRPLYHEGDRLPASYANFYIANDLVMVPTFDDAADGTALGILRELLPDRRVVGLSASDLILGLGSFHCSTQQEPARSDSRWGS